MNIKKEFYNSLEVLENAVNEKNPIKYIRKNEHSFETLNSIFSQITETDDIKSNDYTRYFELLSLFFPKDIKNPQITVDDQTSEESFDNRSKGVSIREGELITIDGKSINKITSYKFDILVKNKPTFSGELSRTEMELIHRLYSSEGANLAVKSLAREFPQYTQQEIKKILRAFIITKACSPLAPHQIEEMGIEEAVGFSVRMKENAIIKKVEEERIRHNENIVR